MTLQQIIDHIRQKQSFLCIGLDTDPARIPSFLLKEKDPVFEFNRRIVDATAEYCVAYKPNTAFFEAQGAAGWESLARTAEILPPTHFRIADAKRGDIGNTSERYAKAFFEQMPFDAVTVAPYMGSDSVKPFLSFPGKWVIVLGLTSNQGSQDFQMRQDQDGAYWFEHVIRTAREWGSPEQLMFVAGATHDHLLENVRRQAGPHFLLVPGVGAQGGDLQTVCKRAALAESVGLLVNASRSILYADSGPDFAKAAAKEARRLQQEMQQLLEQIG